MRNFKLIIGILLFSSLLFGFTESNFQKQNYSEIELTESELSYGGSAYVRAKITIEKKVKGKIEKLTKTKTFNAVVECMYNDKIDAKNALKRELESKMIEEKVYEEEEENGLKKPFPKRFDWEMDGPIHFDIDSCED